MDCWTDYPIAQLGDVPGKPAPVRACKVLAWDGDKYADVEVNGIITNFKVGYLYPVPQRCGLGPSIDVSKLPVGLRDTADEDLSI